MQKNTFDTKLKEKQPIETPRKCLYLLLSTYRLCHVPVQKNALQWTKSPTESETPTDGASAAATPTATSSSANTTSSASAAGPASAPATPAEGTEQESCDSTETTAAASGENDGKLRGVYWVWQGIAAAIPWFQGENT